MAGTGKAFEPGAYIVRYGGRLVLRAITLPCSVAWRSSVFVVLMHKSVVAVVIALIIALVLLGVAGVDLGKVTGREVAFAVHRGGVYFGSDPVKDDVPWSPVVWSSFFTDTFTNEPIPDQNSGVIGVRSLGTQQTARPGNGRAGSATARAVSAVLINARPSRSDCRRRRRD